jgi:hypothetical protein
LFFIIYSKFTASMCTIHNLKLGGKDKRIAC